MLSISTIYPVVLYYSFSLNVVIQHNMSNLSFNDETDCGTDFRGLKGGLR